MANEPTPSPTSSPESDRQPGAAASSRASSRASQSEDPFIADAGPQFDPEAAPAPPPPPPVDAPLEQLAEWEETAIRSLLGVKGRVLHAAAGAAEQDWLYTELDLDAIAPPLTRIANRYEPVRRYAGFSDPVMVFIGMAGYATRSLVEARQAREAAEGDGGTRPIPPAAEAPATAEPPRPDTPPRQAASMPSAPAGAPAPPMQPTEGPAPAPPARPAEADVDPTAINWETASGQ